MDQSLNEELLDKLTKVCLCKGITRSKIKKAIRNGANTLKKVQKATVAGSGGCKGNRYSPKIMELIAAMNNHE